MDTPPPRWVRRLLIAPLVFLVALALSLLSPLIHLVALLLDLVFDRRRFRFTRFVGIGLAFCVVEVFGLFALLTVWLGSGFGLFMKRPLWVKANTVLTGQYLELITRAIRVYLGFSFSYTQTEVSPGPQLVFCRHAGPGDAFLIARIVIRDLGRRLHAVGAAKLQWDPFLDIAGERLGFHYLAQTPADTTAELERIKEIAACLDPDETLVIFPEGGNYTPGRRARVIESLRERDRQDHAELAESLKHTLLPKTGGVMAAVDGAPDAPVVFVAHAGLDDVHGLSTLWTTVPLGRSVVAHGWAASQRPPSAPEGMSTWLFDEWVAVDNWIHITIDSTKPTARR